MISRSVNAAQVVMTKGIELARGAKVHERSEAGTVIGSPGGVPLVSASRIALSWDMLKSNQNSLRSQEHKEAG